MTRPLAALAIFELAVILALVVLLALRDPPLALAPAPGAGGAAPPASHAAASLTAHGAIAAEADAPSVERAPPERRAELSVSAEEADAIGLILWGKVRTRDGSKLPEGSISLRCTEPKRDEWVRVREGSYAVVGLTPGAWKVTCKYTGYALLEHELQLEPTVPRTRLDLVLEPAILVRVKILTPDGQPLDKARQALQEDGGPLSPFYGPFGGSFGDVAVMATLEQLSTVGAERLDGWPAQQGVGVWRAARFYHDRDRPLP